MDDNRRKIKYLTQSATNLYGWRLIIFGALQILAVVLNILAGVWTKKPEFLNNSFVFPVIFLLICVGAGLALKPSFRNFLADKFGRVVRQKMNTERRLAIWSCVIPLIFGFLFSVWVDCNYSLPFSLTVLTVALTNLIFWLEVYRGISKVTLFLAVIFLIFSFLPWNNFFAVWNMMGTSSPPLRFYQNILSLFLGSTYLIVGLDDFRLAYRMLKPAKEEENYESL